MRRGPLIAVCLIGFGLATAAELSGRVVGVTDGDTLTLLSPGNMEEKIRLAGIDAPEQTQPFGQTSKQHLSDMVYGRQVVVDWANRDRYGRIVGKVLVSGQDACIDQVNSGLAWHYVKYAGTQSPADRTTYAAAEAAARAIRAGLWSDSEPVAPWDWRRKKSEKK
jgi:endonuclease YncB( thermonuclease family)